MADMFICMQETIRKKKVYEYTLMPTHMRQMFQPEELQNIELAGPFSFTKGCKVMKIEKKRYDGRHDIFWKHVI